MSNPQRLLRDSPNGETAEMGNVPTPPKRTHTRHLVVIPAYNEEESLASTLTSLQALSLEYDLLVINDGSVDATGAIAERAAKESTRPIHIIHLPTNSGIGATVQTGYQFARLRGGYEFVIQCDADGQHDPLYIPALIEACNQADLDLCIGSRFLQVEPAGDRSTFWRRVGIRFFAWLISRLSGAQVTDPTSGFRCAGPRAWGRFARYYPEDYPEPESLFWCVRNKLRVGEIPVQMRARSGGVSSIANLRGAYYMMKVSLAILIDRIRAQEA